MGWPAPAKLNLFLRILGRRPDGYHELQTVFQFLDLADEVEIRVRSDGRIERSVSIPGVPVDTDLAIRAARLLQAETGTPLGADVGVHKRIPMGAGLGGGSSDAATALVILNRLWATRVPDGRLAELGLKLGADVPVFVGRRAAWAEGVGERLTPVEIPEPWYLIVHPGCHVSTAAVFSAPGLTRNSPPMKIPCLLRGGVTNASAEPAVAALFEAAGNDCQAVVRRQYPEVDEVFRWLADLGCARLTGTGAGVFLPCPSEAEARHMESRIPDRWRAFVARGRNRSPL